MAEGHEKHISGKKSENLDSQLKKGPEPQGFNEARMGKLPETAKQADQVAKTAEATEKMETPKQMLENAGKMQSDAHTAFKNNDLTSWLKDNGPKLVAYLDHLMGIPEHKENASKIAYEHATKTVVPHIDKLMASSAEHQAKC